jgi:hypothetical protein
VGRAQVTDPTPECGPKSQIQELSAIFLRTSSSAEVRFLLSSLSLNCFSNSIRGAWTENFLMNRSSSASSPSSLRMLSYNAIVSVIINAPRLDGALIGCRQWNYSSLDSSFTMYSLTASRKTCEKFKPIFSALTFK